MFPSFATHGLPKLTSARSSAQVSPQLDFSLILNFTLNFSPKFSTLPRNISEPSPSHRVLPSQAMLLSPLLPFPCRFLLLLGSPDLGDPTGSLLPLKPSPARRSPASGLPPERVIVSLWGQGQGALTLTGWVGGPDHLVYSWALPLTNRVTWTSSLIILDEPRTFISKMWWWHTCLIGLLWVKIKGMNTPKMLRTEPCRCHMLANVRALHCAMTRAIC